MKRYLSKVGRQLEGTVTFDAALGVFFSSPGHSALASMPKDRPRLLSCSFDLVLATTLEALAYIHRLRAQLHSMLQPQPYLSPAGVAARRSDALFSPSSRLIPLRQSFIAAYRIIIVKAVE